VKFSDSRAPCRRTIPPNSRCTLRCPAAAQRPTGAPGIV
jgi:hypothetical protein